ncbi:peptide chain release factor N(5)-glutamine methyltransferase [Mucilaginibacter aquaedulcis]|uniref:peptide chain release factor N(5)-glutamine methyltransferase n=1 Tax=Mucilaginibacter aquaedulcis TaxID=1187081 RepID=UPI0025B33682|nr:peptide chain release factor N(5)-glutamine methyltransferase [Mucilaginibacter aquaedulcis]MDN3547739.1 peptide chain release factor N(5)-glutamine methyltransferase [Mucilaginibacter aquaedulcis]
MITIKDVFEDYKQLKKVYEPNEIEAITLFTISEISQLSKASIKAFPERELSSQQEEQLKNILTQLLTGQPIQYILGVTEFYGLPFKVNPSVLIPRPETEELVEWILSSVAEGQKHKAESVKQFTGGILDIGTGSGCIAISLKKNLANAQVSAIDISETALQTARENAVLNEVDVNFIHADILNYYSTPHTSPPAPQYHIIVSNPPYVTVADKKQMHTNVTDFEPHSALFVPEDDPLIFYRAIAHFAKANLQPGGLLFFEINESYGQETIELLQSMGFTNTELRKDMSGRNRMTKAVIG